MFRLFYGSSFLLLFSFVAIAVVISFGDSTNEKAISSKFKAPCQETPVTVTKRWKEEDEQLWEYVESHVPAVLEHTGATAFDEHLKGVQAVLRYWNAPKYLTSAGLFHSIYGTEGFQGFTIPLSERSKIQELIGVKAEKLCFIFCMVDRYTVDQTVFSWKIDDHLNTDDGDDHDKIYATFQSRPEMGRFPIEVTKEEWLDFIELTLSDWLEQVEGAALKPNKNFLWKQGEAFSYRRLAYKRMSEILSAERADRLGSVAPKMLHDVMSTEPQETQHLVQARTPPISAAAASALAALRAIGEQIPEDLRPQPIPNDVTHSTEECANTVRVNAV